MLKSRFIISIFDILNPKKVRFDNQPFKKMQQSFAEDDFNIS